MPGRRRQSKREEPLFAPKLFSTLRSYSLTQFWGDLSGGVIVGIVALPLAIAFAIASGVTPEKGLITAIVAGLLISVFGGSRVQIGGPTGAFVILVYHIVERFGVNGLIVCTLLAGVILVLMGLLRLGTAIKFIPYPLTVGFTAGIAVVIFSSQLRDFFGLHITGALPADFLDKIQIYSTTFSTLDYRTTGLALCSLLIMVTWPRVSRKIPGSIVAILIITGVVHYFQIPVETIGSRFGALPDALPHPTWPRFTFAEMRMLIGPAFTVALLGAIESLLSATVADGMIEGRHRSNTELIAQGIANIASPLFGGIPATGAIARTATNVRNGGRTPIAGIVHALTLFGIVLLFGRWATMIPLCVLAAILIVVSYHMSEWRAFRALLRAPRMDVSVLVTTFLLTVFADLTVAVEVGMLMSVVLFMKRMSDVTKVREVTREMQSPTDEKTLRDAPDATSRRTLPKGVVVYEAEGAFFFGVAAQLRETLSFGDTPPKVIILRMRHVLALDASGIRAVDELRKGCARFGTQLILEGIRAQPRKAIAHEGLLDTFGLENVCVHLDAAIERANQLLQK